MVYLSFLGSHPLTILPKYIGQFFMTLWLLIRHRPAAVMVMSPPIFAAFAPLLYCLIMRRPFGLDCHTAAFMHPRFQRLQWLQAAIERRAAINIVHNEYLRGIVVGRGGRAVVVRDVPVVYEAGEVFELTRKFNVTVVCSFNPDEPVEAILEAARLSPTVQFYMTGNPKHLCEKLKFNIPPNVTLTGFVSDAAYGSLISRSDVVMSLTTRDHTMLRGAWEAIYQGTPVIVSDWPILREAFDKGAVHSDNSARAIAAAIEVVRGNQIELRREAGRARCDRIDRWKCTRTKLQKILNHSEPE